MERYGKAWLAVSTIGHYSTIDGVRIEFLCFENRTKSFLVPFDTISVARRLGKQSRSTTSQTDSENHESTNASTVES